MMKMDNNYDSYVAMGSMITQGFYPARDPKIEQIERYNREQRKNRKKRAVQKIASLMSVILSSGR